MNYPDNYNSRWDMDPFEESIDEELNDASMEGPRPVKTWREEMNLFVLWSDDSITTYPLKRRPYARDPHTYKVTKFCVRLEHLQCTIYHEMKSLGFQSPNRRHDEYLVWRDDAEAQNA